MRFRFLHPSLHFPYLGNEASCVLRIETAQGAMLLTGDIGEVIERELLRRDPSSIRAEVVQIAHHGSRGSSDAAFVAATRARIGVVSTGHGNRFRHPHPDTLARWNRSGAEVADTSRGGALRIRLQAAGPVFEQRRDVQRRLWDAVRRQERAAQLSYRPD